VKVLPNHCAATENLEPRLYVEGDGDHFDSLAFLDHSVCVVVMNRFVALCFDPVPIDTFVFICLYRNVSDQVFNKNRMVVRPLRDSFLVGAFEQAVQLGAGGRLHQLNQILDPNASVETDRKLYLAALVMRSVTTDCL
jgi:hypothetical protein